MDIKKIYERYASGISQPNIVEHFYFDENVYDNVIDELISRGHLSNEGYQKTSSFLNNIKN